MESVSAFFSVHSEALKWSGHDMASQSQKDRSKTPQTTRLEQRFDADWRFSQNDEADASGAAFDDASWRALDLPHDWSIEDLSALLPGDGGAGGSAGAAATPHVRGGPFDSHAEGGGSQGFTVGGVGWYRKTFKVPRSWRGRHVRLTFDGVYMNCRVWCNGEAVAEHPYGYTGFHADLTAHLKPGAINTIAVRVDASGRTSRWYPGAGIYRHVTLTVTDPVHISPWGIAVTTPKVARGTAVVRVRTVVRNDSDEAQNVTLELRLLAPSGRKAGDATTRQTIPADSEIVFEQSISVASPHLWSPDAPELYRAVSTVKHSGETADVVTTPFGIRSVKVDAARGLRLNGKRITLRGACVHHDNGALGSCTYDRAEERRVEILKAAGFNAIRTAHNPPSSTFLDACDRLGMLVMDEAFDTWLLPKNPEDYGKYFAAWWPRDIASMVRRDRNHPSIIFWSIGNEINGQDKPECLQYSEVMSDFVRKLDPSRPVTQAFMPIGNWDDMFPGFDALDVVGYNYKSDRYVADHQKRPQQVIAGTESFPSACFDSWMAVLDLPHVIGDFVWTGYDYIGEAALGRTAWDGVKGDTSTAWPWTVAYCGDIDLCGWRRAPSHYREAVFGVRPVVSCFVRQADAPEGGLGPWGWMDEQACWTWEGMDGQPLKVNVYSSCPRVQLVLNGRVLGTKETTRATRFIAEWEVPYEPGELVAVGLDAGNHEQVRWVLKTAGKPAALRLRADRTTVASDGQDLCFVDVEVVDEQGVMHARADHLVQFNVKGPATIVAVANGNPCSLESFQQPQRRAFRGRCQVVIKSGTKKGVIRLTAAAEGLAGSEAVINTRG
jgi:beta-galactosidase